MERRVPLDLWGLIARHLFHLTARRCINCDRGVFYEMRNPQMTAYQLVCKRWRLGWRRMIGQITSSYCHLICFRPAHCMIQYLREAPHPPGIIVLRGWTPDEDRETLRNRCRELEIVPAPGARNERHP